MYQALRLEIDCFLGDFILYAALGFLLSCIIMLYNAMPRAHRRGSHSRRSLALGAAKRFLRSRRSRSLAEVFPSEDDASQAPIRGLLNLAAQHETSQEFDWDSSSDSEVLVMHY
jgi:hypothetical protein